MEIRQVGRVILRITKTGLRGYILYGEEKTFFLSIHLHMVYVLNDLLF